MACRQVGKMAAMDRKKRAKNIALDALHADLPESRSRCFLPTVRSCRLRVLLCL